MPFTPTHMLAIVPIARVKRLGLPFSALLIGSMIPDLPLFARIGPGYGETHSAGGLLTACLPLGLGVYLLFQRLMKGPLYAVLPEGMQSRCRELMEPGAGWGAWELARAAAAVVIGAATHVFWDGFTHRGMWGTAAFPSLNETALTVGGRALPWYKVLQEGSSLVGLPWLGWLLAGWLSRRRALEAPVGLALPVGWKAAAGVVGLLVPMGMGLLACQAHDGGLQGKLFELVTVSGRTWMVVLLAYCAGYQAVKAAGRWRAGETEPG